MNVAELQLFLSSVAPFARAAGASEKVVSELDRALQCLEPFKDRSLADFNDFLRRADEFDRTGKLTPPPRAAAAKRSAAPKMSVDEAVQIFNGLHQRATDPALTYTEIDVKIAPLEKLTVPQLKEVAQKVGVTVTGKTKKPILADFVRRIKELKASSERTQYRFGA